MHCDEDVAPFVPEYVPAIQYVQLDAPAADHVPALHCVHVADDVAPVADDEYPALQFIQVVATFAPSVVE